MASFLTVVISCLFYILFATRLVSKIANIAPAISANRSLILAFASYNHLDTLFKNSAHRCLTQITPVTMNTPVWRPTSDTSTQDKTLRQ